MPVLVLIPFTNEAGWYGTGVSGAVQRCVQFFAILLGSGAAIVTMWRGSFQQRLWVSPAALLYAIVLISILVENSKINMLQLG